MQAEGGLMSITGAADGPRSALGVAIADLGRRPARRSGHRRSRCSRASGPAAGSTWTSACSTASSRCSPITPRCTSPPATVPQRIGNRHATIAPYDTFSAADGEFFLAVGNDDQFRRFCACDRLARAVTATQRFATNPARVVHHGRLRERLAPVLRAQPRAYWMRRPGASRRPVRSRARCARRLVGSADWPRAT